MTAVAYAPQLTILNEAIGLRNPEDLYPGFDVFLDGRWFPVTAVLERTVVFDVDRDTKALAGFGRVEVDAESLHWREAKAKKMRWNGLGVAPVVEKPGLRNCSKGGHKVPYVAFASDGKGGQQSWCRDCVNRYNRERMAAKKAEKTP